MTRRGKKYRSALGILDQSRSYDLLEAVELVKKMAFAGFDETLELILKLGIDPRRSDQAVRGTVPLPHGTGKKVRILVFCPFDQIEEAQAAGAEYAGGKELVEKIKGGWLEFDVAVASKEMMREVSPLGKVLGPRGLMPSPKAGTVTENVPRTVKEIKAGKIEFKSDKFGNIQVAVGKVSFFEQQLAENIQAVVKEIIHSRPATAKGKYLQKAFIVSTMGPSVKIDVQKLAGV
jgi:large subunit ribosomal protein L1